MLGTQGVVSCHDHGTLDHIAKLAPISGPAMGAQQLQCPIREPPDVLARTGGELPGEVRGKKKEVVTSIDKPR